MKKNMYVVLFLAALLMHQYQENRLFGRYERRYFLSDESATGNEDSEG